jgi:hypothetical protein
MKKVLLLLMVVGCTCPILIAQPQLKDYKESAQEAAAAKDYATALVHSREVLAEEPNNLEYLAIATEAALEYCEFELANNFLYRIESLDTANAVPQFTFLKGKYMHRTGEYEEAEMYYEKYRDQCQQSGSTTPYLAIATTMLDHLEASRTQSWFVDYNTSYLDRGIDVEASDDVDIVLQGGRDSSLFAMPLYNDSLYYTAIGPELKSDCACTNLCDDDIALFRYETAGLSRLVTSTDGLTDVGHIAYGDGGNRMYFTQCKCSDGTYSCNIYYRDRNPDQGVQDQDGVTWGPAQKIEAIAWDGFNVTQPFVYTNPAGTDYLFFVTDYTTADDPMRDLDIWYVTVNNGVIGEPYRLETVNTDGDDMTPFYHEPTQTFYFSTNGRASLGGYDFDIYQISGAVDNLDARTITNIGAPINSRFDDYYYSISQLGDKGYFSSNRHARSASGDMHDFTYCCPDIFEIELKTDLPILVYCGIRDVEIDQAMEPLDYTQVQLVDETGATPPAVRDLTVNTYTFEELSPSARFMLVGTKAQYRPDSSRIGSLTMTNDTAVVILEPEMKLEVGFRDRCEDTLPVEVDAIFVVEGFPASAPTSWDTTRYERYTDGCFNEGSSLFEIALKPEHKYIILADTLAVADPSYLFCTNTFFEFETPCEPFAEEILFRLEKPDEIAPIPPLYFDHAIPSRNLSRTKSEFDYFELVNNYLGREQEYKDFTRCNDDATTVTTLFEDIKRNQNQMISLVGATIEFLEFDDLKIEIAGFASSSASGGYSNSDLTKRRIDSMRKYFEKILANKKAEIDNTIDDPEEQEYLKSRYDISNIEFVEKALGASLAGKRDDLVSGLFGTAPPPKRGDCRIYNVRSSRDRALQVVSMQVVSEDGTANVLAKVTSTGLALNLLDGIVDDINIDDPERPELILTDGTSRILNQGEYNQLLEIIRGIEAGLGRTGPSQSTCPCPEEIIFESQRTSTIK